MGKRSFSVSIVATGSVPGGSSKRYLLRNIAPGVVRPALAGKSALTITVGPSAKPSLSRSGSSAITPAICKVCPEMTKLPPAASSSRARASGETQAVPGAGAPTLRPSLSVRRPTSGQAASTAFSSTGTASSPLAAMACSRVPPESWPNFSSSVRSAGVAARCHTSTCTSPPRMVCPRSFSSRSIAPVRVPIAASAPTPRNRQASSSRRPRKRADRSRRAIVQAVDQGRTELTRRYRSQCGHRPG